MNVGGMQEAVVDLNTGCLIISWPTDVYGTGDSVEISPEYFDGLAGMITSKHFRKINEYRGFVNGVRSACHGSLDISNNGYVRSGVLLRLISVLEENLAFIEKE